MPDGKLQRVTTINALQGKLILGWRGSEMALREGDVFTDPVWEDPSVPMLQVCPVTLTLENCLFTITTCQHNDQFGLSVAQDHLPEPEEHHDPCSIFRTRQLAELPTGMVSKVHVELAKDNAIATIRLEIGGDTVDLKAGEVYEEWDGSLRIVYMDESILIQVNGEKPGSAA